MFLEFTCTLFFPQKNLDLFCMKIKNKVIPKVQWS